MPAKSARQYRAMAAAASGHSTLGIPQNVGKEFIKHKPQGEHMFGSLISKLAQKKGLGTSRPKPQKTNQGNAIGVAMRKMAAKKMAVSSRGTNTNQPSSTDNNEY